MDLLIATASTMCSTGLHLLYGSELFHVFIFVVGCVPSLVSYFATKIAKINILGMLYFTFNYCSLFDDEQFSVFSFIQLMQIKI